MRRSTDRILVSHAGTLPRSPQIVALLQRGPSGEAELAQLLPAAVKDIVRRQVEVGVDIVNDGEIPKRGTFSSYIQQRVQGIEARTFGMDAMFPTAKIYSPHGQRYDPVDAEMLLSYKEDTRGQILHEGISESGSMASFIAAGSAYGEPAPADVRRSAPPFGARSTRPPAPPCGPREQAAAREPGRVRHDIRRERTRPPSGAASPTACTRSTG